MYKNNSEENFTDIMSSEFAIENFVYSDESTEIESVYASSNDCSNYTESPKTPRSHVSHETCYSDSNDSTIDPVFFEKEEKIIKDIKEYKKSIKIKNSKCFLDRIKNVIFYLVR